MIDPAKRQFLAAKAREIRRSIVEDIAIMRAFPNITVLVAGDYEQAHAAAMHGPSKSGWAATNIPCSPSCAANS